MELAAVAAVHFTLVVEEAAPVVLPSPLEVGLLEEVLCLWEDLLLLEVDRPALVLETGGPPKQVSVWIMRVTTLT